MIFNIDSIFWKMVMCYIPLILLISVCLIADGHDNEEESPEEELYGVKYARDCEGKNY